MSESLKNFRHVAIRFDHSAANFMTAVHIVKNITYCLQIQTLVKHSKMF